MHRGILGGTFDPLHLAHLVAGETAYRDLGLDIVTFIPTGAPWQKQDSDVTPARHRWEMTLRSIEGVDYFEADDREIRRGGWTYTVDTLDSFPAEEHITLIMGADTAAGLPTWERYQPVLERCDIAVYPRPGTTRDAVESALADADFVWLDAAELDIQATEIRAHARTDGSVRFLVRDAVWRYIQEHEVYGSGASLS